MSRQRKVYKFRMEPTPEQTQQLLCQAGASTVAHMEDRKMFESGVMNAIFTFFFGCRHPANKRSWPFSENGGQVYRVCNECGKRIPYRNEILFPNSARRVA